MGILIILVFAAIIIGAVRKTEKTQKPKRINMRKSPTFVGDVAPMYTQEPREAIWQREADESIKPLATPKAKMMGDVTKQSITKPTHAAPKTTCRLEVEDVETFSFDTEEIRKAVIYSEILNRRV